MSLLLKTMCKLPNIIKIIENDVKTAIMKTQQWSLNCWKYVTTSKKNMIEGQKLLVNC